MFVGKGLSLAAWEAQHGSPGNLVSGSTKICDTSVVTAVASQPAQIVEVFDPSNHHEGIAATTTVTVAFTRAGVGVIAQWTVDDAQREQLRESEERFFASIHCE